MTTGNVPLDTAKLRAFIAHCPKNAVMVYTTGWHVMAAELMRRMADVVEAAADLGIYCNRSLNDNLCVLNEDAAERLDGALLVLYATLNKQKEPVKCDSPS